MATDIKRWSDPNSLQKGWNERTILMAKMIPPEAYTVIEFGAGDCILKNWLWTHQEYVPSDLVDRGHGTIVYDLNETPYSFIERRYDVAFFSGVFEYIEDLPQLVDYVSTFTDCVVCSYANFAPEETQKRNGWVNNYTQNQFKKMFIRKGFKLVDENRWKTQKLYTFKR